LREERRLRVFENRVLKRIFGPKRDEITGSGENFIILYYILLIQYCAGDKIEKNEMGAVCSSDGEGGFCTGFCWGNLRERDHWGEPGVDERIILWRIFRKWDAWLWTGLSWLRLGTGAGTCECGNEHLGSINVGEFLA
jgi:hypothetical protein